MLQTGDRQGMIQDLHVMQERMWWKRGDSGLSGEPCVFVQECERLMFDLGVETQCPDLIGCGLRGDLKTKKYRCGQCDGMQHGGTVMFWVSDSIMMGDPLWTIKTNLNGDDGSGWCSACVRKLFRRAK